MTALLTLENVTRRFGGLKAVDAVGTDDADTVLAKLREMTIQDPFAANGHIRSDELNSHDMYLVRIKAPKQSQGPGDYYNVLKVLHGEVANIPLAKSECPLSTSERRC